MKRFIVFLLLLFLLTGCSSSKKYDVNTNITYTNVTIEKLEAHMGRGAYYEVSFSSNAKKIYTIPEELYRNLEDTLNVAKKMKTEDELKFNLIVTIDDEILAISLAENKIN